MSNSIKIYTHPLSGHGHRVVLFANLAGIAHDVIEIDLVNGEHKKEPFLSINPDGQVPAIEDGNIALSDANAILVYLARKYAPQYYPDDLEKEVAIQKVFTLAAGDIAFGPAAARLIHVFGAALDEKFAHQIAHRALKKLDSAMIGKHFLVGDQPSLADIAVYSYIKHAPEGGVSLDAYTNVLRLLSNIESLPNFVPMVTTKAGLLK